jgi:hypothetical protein
LPATHRVPIAAGRLPGRLPPHDSRKPAGARWLRRAEWCRQTILTNPGSLREPGGNKTAPSSFNRSMEKAVAYLISVGIVGFGFWIIFASMAGSSGSGLMWIAGSVPVAVGLFSLFNEILNTP